MPKIPPGYMPLDDALAELGPALVGKGWIGELTPRERWLVEKHKSGRSIIDGLISYVGPGGIPFDLRTELDAALNRDSTMRSQREQGIEWLDDRDLLFETADGDEDDDDAVVPVAKFRAALERWRSKSKVAAQAASDVATPAPAAPPEPTRRKQRKKDAEADANLTNRILAVIAEARRKWPDSAKRPPASEMAEQLAGMAKRQDFKPETVRQIIRGSYRPMKRLEIKPL